MSAATYHKPARVVPLCPVARLAFHRDYSRERRATFRAAGLCPRCKADVEPGKSECRACLTRGGKVRRKRAALGLPDCPPGTHGCPDCLAPTPDAHRRCDRCRVKRGNNRARLQAARRQRALALGLCGDWRRELAAPGRRSCPPCLERNAARTRARYAKGGVR